MAPAAVAAEVRSNLDALQRHFDTIAANSTNQRVLDATYEAECIVKAMWPGDDTAASVDRWRDYGLSKTQARMVDLMHSRLGKTVSRDSLASCWTAVGMDHPEPKNIEVQMWHVRKKLRKSPYRVATEWAVGYRMELKPT